jgi:MraZ protein
MFIGEYVTTIDAKGRIAVPAKFRSKLAGQLVITRGLDNALVIYTMPEWTKLAEKLAALPQAGSNTRAYSRLMLAGAVDCEIDAQGRIIVPTYLKEFASLSRKAVFAGLYNRIELWSEERWQSYKQATEPEANHIAESLTDLGV